MICWVNRPWERLLTSPAYASEETAEAIAVARQMDLPLVTLETHELEDSRYVINDVNRCYFCKTELFSQLVPLAKQYNLGYIAYGINQDDDGDFRPGQRAAREFGVRGPLKEARMGKQAIRDVARMLNIPVWDKPAMACFSSRIPYGSKVDVASLQMIYKAEKSLARTRVSSIACAPSRYHGTHRSRAIKIARLIEDEMSRIITDGLRNIGYTYVTVDLLGYRTGSMNEGFFKKKIPETH